MNSLILARYTILELKFCVNGDHVVHRRWRWRWVECSRRLTTCQTLSTSVERTRWQVDCRHRWVTVSRRRSSATTNFEVTSMTRWLRLNWHRATLATLRWGGLSADHTCSCGQLTHKEWRVRYVYSTDIFALFVRHCDFVVGVVTNASEFNTPADTVEVSVSQESTVKRFSDALCLCTLEPRAWRGQN